MADVFRKSEAKTLLKDKFILLIGDSNMRSIYKDLLCLLHEGGITPEGVLRRGSECVSQYGEEIVDRSSIKLGRDYFEVRQCKKEDVWVRFIFVTKVCAPTLMKEIKALEDKVLPFPAVIIINSCLWDITRWGPEQEDQYKQNVANLFHRLQSLLPKSSLVIWTASLPVASERVKGGVFIKQIEFVKHSMRFMLLEANVFTQNLCRMFGFAFLDLHYYMQYQLHRRSNDGLHWEPPAVRYMTNLLLTHIALSFNEQLPGNVTKSILLQKHDKIKASVSLQNDEREKLYFDSKFVKYLKELGLEVKHLISCVSPSDEKEKQPQKKVVQEAEGTGNNKSLKSRKRNDKSKQRKKRYASLNNFYRNANGSYHGPRSNRNSRNRVVWSFQEGMDMNQLCADVMSYADVRLNRFSNPHFTGYGQLNSMQNTWAYPGMNTGWPSQGYSHHVQQSNQHTYNLAPIEFWRDYPVNNLPFN